MQKPSSAMMMSNVCETRLHSWLMATFNASITLFSCSNRMKAFWSIFCWKKISILRAMVEFPVSLMKSAIKSRNLTNSAMAGGMMSQKNPAMAANINNKVMAIHKIRLWR